MAKTVTWKPKATLQYRELITYLNVKFSETTAQKFIEKVTSKMTQLEQYPESGHPTRFAAIRRVKIGKYNSFYYRISGAKIIILFIWDARIDPGKNPFI